MQTLSPDSERKNVGLYDGIEVTSIVRTWWFYRRFIMTTTLFITLMTMLIVGSQERLFTSTSLIRVHYASHDNVVTGSPDGQNLRNNPVIANSLVFMASRSFLNMVAEEEELYDDPEFSREQAASRVEGDVDQRTDHERALKSAVIDALAERLVAAQRGGSHVISVEATSNSPQKSARIANAAVEIFKEKELSRLEEMEQKHLDWLTGQIRDSRGQLASLEGEVLALSSKHGLSELRQDPFAGRVANVQWTELTTQLANIKAERAAIQARHKNARSWAENHGVDASLIIAKSPALDELRNLETALERRLSELERDLGERHPTIINIRKNLELTRQRMIQEANGVLLRARDELIIVNAREAEVEARIDTLKLTISDQQDVRSKIGEIERDINRNQGKLDSLVERSITINENQMIRRGLTDIISPANVATRYSYPNTWPAVSYASICTILLCLLGIFFHDRWVSDFGFTSPEDLKALSMNPIGIVPELTVEASEGTMAEDQAVMKPHTVEAEAIQRIRNHLSKLRPNGSTTATIVAIASSSPQEGKTTMAVALARQAAIGGSRVLFIDANIRHPSVADLMGIESAAGLSELLLEDAQNEPQIGQDPLTRLHILQAGNCTVSPADLFRSSQMTLLVQELRQHYEWIFVDSPSIGAVVDGVILAQHADLVVYVARWLATTRNIVQMGIDQLRDAGVTCAGVALTRVDMTSYQKYAHMEEFGYYGYSSTKS